jgi:hypothetical protein
VRDLLASFQRAVVRRSCAVSSAPPASTARAT